MQVSIKNYIFEIVLNKLQNIFRIENIILLQDTKYSVTENQRKKICVC